MAIGSNDPRLDRLGTEGIDAYPDLVRERAAIKIDGIVMKLPPLIGAPSKEFIYRLARIVYKLLRH